MRKICIAIIVTVLAQMWAFTASANIISGPFSAAGVPAPTCNAGNKGLDIYVTDATSPTGGGGYTSGGSSYAALNCNGSSYVVVAGSSVGAFAAAGANSDITSLSALTHITNACVVQGPLSLACAGGTPLQYTNWQDWGNGAQAGGNVAFGQHSNDQSSAFAAFVKTRSTTAGDATVSVQAGDGLSELSAVAADGTSFHYSATENWSVDDTVSTGIVPTNWQIWNGNISGTHSLSLLLDSRSNMYLRNGFLGIGPAFGYNPPTPYVSGNAPPYPLSIKNTTAGTAAGVWYTGSSGGGAEIRISNGFSSTVPIYADWFNDTTGIGNPATNVESIIIAGAEAWRVDNLGHQSFTSASNPSLSACGTSPSIDSAATDMSGTVTAGSGALASCTVTFIHPYGTDNHCIVSPHTLTLTGAAYSYTLSAITVTATSLTSAVFDYRCDGK
jgi:hypothetical protein